MSSWLCRETAAVRPLAARKEGGAGISRQLFEFMHVGDALNTAAACAEAGLGIAKPLARVRAA
ncbi:MAG: hypothetical protein AAF636_14815 [Pseudomonadota bacterium]